MVDDVTVRRGFVIPASQLQWRFSRSSGPGGQSVNTSDSRVSLSFDVATAPSVPEQLRRRALRRLEGRLVDGVLTVHAETERSQLRNRELATRRLAQLLRDATRPAPPPRRPTRPTTASRERRLLAKRTRSARKRDRRTPGPDD
jgi:ribosome-associated protein